MRFFIRVASCVIAFLGTATTAARAGTPTLAAQPGTVFAAGRTQAAIGPGAIAAVVRDASGKPIVDALVVADGPTTRSATTGAAGIATLQALPVGTYDVRVSRSGFAPLERMITIAAAGSAPTFMDLRVVATDLAAADDAASSAQSAGSPADDPYAAHTLAATPEVDVVNGETSSASIVDGTTSNDSRSEIDGVPLAASAVHGAALTPPSALAFVHVDVAPGLAAATADSARDTVGGTIDYRTAPIDGARTGGLEVGHDSAFGSFQQTRFSGTFGRVGVFADAVTGGGAARTQIVKTRYAFSSTTSLGLASYAMQTADATAPIATADLQTKLGTATFEARTYRSAARDAIEDDRVRGTQLAIDVPSGENRIALGFDRRTESTTLAGVSIAQTFSTVTLRTGLQVARTVRVELADAYGGGTALARRHDPHVTLLVRATDRITLRIGAGSAYATAPVATVATTFPAERYLLRAPETSFGYRASADARIDANDRAFLAVYTLRRFDALAALASARSTGVALGIERLAPPSGFGGAAYLDFSRAYAFGAVQPLARNVDTTPLVAFAQLPGDASSKARLVAEYRSRTGIEVRVGTTFLGANNALASHGLPLGDAALTLPLGTLLNVRIGVQNAFSQVVSDPILAREFPPHEITLSLGRR